MAKIFGILLIVLGVWLGLEIYTKGMQGAFGGALARFAEPARAGSASADDRTIPQRAGAKVESEITGAEQRRMSGVEDEN